MKKYFCFLFFAFFISNTSFCTEKKFSIVFIHIGDQLPEYTETAIIQARLFNPTCPIILISNQKTLDRLSQSYQDNDVILVACESVQKTPEHLQYLEFVEHEPGFWRYTSERFLYLYDIMLQMDLKNVFHLENDNMLYVDLSTLLSIFKKNYKGIGATFDNDGRAIAGFMYVANAKAMQKLASMFVSLAPTKYNDMEIIALFKDGVGPSSIDYLPVLMKSYGSKHPLKSKSGLTTKNPNRFSNHSEKFNSIFDAAAIGQYFDGSDRFYHPEVQPGFENESSLFNPKHFKYQWIKDKQGRKIPYAGFKKKSYRINNLHIHSKRLNLFKSL